MRLDNFGTHDSLEVSASLEDLAQDDQKEVAVDRSLVNLVDDDVGAIRKRFPTL